MVVKVKQDHRYQPTTPKGRPPTPEDPTTVENPTNPSLQPSPTLHQLIHDVTAKMALYSGDALWTASSHDIKVGTVCRDLPAQWQEK